MLRELHYAGESVIVSVDICEAVFDYARALANAKHADVVRIPILVNGERAYSNMLIGPSSQLFCTPGPESDVDLEDAELIADMRSRTAALGPTRAVADSGYVHVAESPYLD